MFFYFKILIYVTSPHCLNFTLLTLYPKSYFQLTFLDFMCFSHLLLSKSCLQCTIHTHNSIKRTYENGEQKSFWNNSKPKYIGLCYLNWTSNTFTSRVMTLLCNWFRCLSMSTLICLFCLLYCNLGHYFIFHPSQTQWEDYFLLQKPVFLKMVLYISPQVLKSSEFLSCPSRVTHSLQLWNISPFLSTRLPPALLPKCAAQNWTLHSSWGLANAFQRKGCFPHPTGSTPVYTMEQDIFLYSLGLLTHI